MTRTADIQEALRKRYGPPEWAYFSEVGNSTGYTTNRHADGLALNLWPSRGMELHGFEIKVSRTDWRRELAKPEKAETIAAYCDRWWVVAPESVGILPSELPPTWGLLRLKPDGKWKVDVDAPRLEAKPLSRSFIAAVMRRASVEDPSAEALKQERSKGFEEGLAVGKSHAESEIASLKDRVADLREREQQFERIAGVRFDTWSAPVDKVAIAMKRALELGKLETEIERVRDHIEGLYRRVCNLREDGER
jgi:hypothetical protein